MKTVINLKMVIMFVLTLNLQSTIVDQQSFNLYAQDQELFEHTWYFSHGELDGDDFFLPYPNFRSEIGFQTDAFGITHPDCEKTEALVGDIDYYSTSANEFYLIDEAAFILLGVCSDYDFIIKHYSIYYIDLGIAKNPFTYTINPVGNHYQLTIENGEGDWAVYNSILLSNPGFSKEHVVVYPNPANEVIYVQHQNSTQHLKATIFDLNGKPLYTQNIAASQSEINIASLNSGVYFLVLEGEQGIKVTKKLVKQ